ncbi:hypothetical protein HUA74_18385 [Myxococcus sp. CA051A]|uniref:hypothetical protein n=1 Tax=Myxococcus sp. CA051A TaxID=2741739 RepID=UPI00157B09A7|nr:hypothetical protein [Myxococcus sp. CA051A]NTX62623.1 hypothetical protein [Myxococcus sp. CA051A]
MSDTNNSGEKKSNKSWGRDLGFFGLGLVVGAGGTVIAGHLTNGAVPVPEPLKTTSK